MTAWRPAGPAWLFCPADRPDRYLKAAAAADVVILDLEDAVAAADKAAARAALADTALDPDRTVVRLNPAGTEDHERDRKALAGTDYRRVMVAKCESPHHAAGLADLDVVALIETPRGAFRVGEIAQVPNVVGLMWGAEDLVAAMGGRGSRGPDGSYRDVVRQVRGSTLLAAKAFGLFALDAVHMHIEDRDRLADEAADAAAVGFDGKVAIHPSQVAVIRAAYAPSDDQIEWARAVLAEAAHRAGVFAFRGRMVDAPVLRHAERILGTS